VADTIIETKFLYAVRFYVMLQEWLLCSLKSHSMCHCRWSLYAWAAASGSRNTPVGGKPIGESCAAGALTCPAAEAGT